MEDLDTHDREQIRHIIQKYNLDNAVGPAGSRWLRVKVGPKGMEALKRIAGELNMVGGDSPHNVLQLIVRSVLDDITIARNLTGARKTGGQGDE